MRARSLAVALFAVASWSCSDGEDVGSGTPAEDLSANFVGMWIGRQTGSVAGQPVSPGLVGLPIERTGANRLRLGGTCIDGSDSQATVEAADRLRIDRFVCPAVALEGCSSVTLEWTSGSGTVADGLLTLEMSGTVRGCGETFQILLGFEALRDAPPPAIAALSPAYAMVGAAATTLTVNGAGFAPGAVVTFNGTVVPTTFVSTSEVRAPLAQWQLQSPGTFPVAVTNVDGQLSLPRTFEVRNPVPVIASATPAVFAAGTPGATVAIAGSGFLFDSSASCDGSSRWTEYVSPTALVVQLGAADLAEVGVRQLTVTNRAPGGGASNAFELAVVNPEPFPTGVSPPSLPAGEARAFVTVTGTGFTSSTVVLWNGSARRTHVGSSTVLSAEIPASDLAQPGTAEISVRTPAPGGGTAVAGTVGVAEPAAELARAVAYQLGPSHAGHAPSGGTLAFADAPAWSVPLPDLLSYPLVVDGKVFVLVRGSATGGYGTRLLALDLATGATLWGPVAIAGTYFWAGHAYDVGRVFVVSYDGDLRAFDAATGAAGWSVDLPGSYSVSSAPAAVDGVVYVGGGRSVHAVDAQTGAVRWTQAVVGSDESSPAVGPDGVYVSYPCQVHKLDRATGATIWHRSTGCSGGGGKTAAYEDGRLYVRDFRSYDTPVGAVHDAFDGAVTDTFGPSAYVPIPAVVGGTRYVRVADALERWELGATEASWRFTGDGQLTSAPIVIDDAVVIGSAGGQVFAVDAATGLERWSGAAGAAVLGPDEQNVSQPLTGLGAGEGYLVVPAGSRLTAWRIVAP